MYRVTERGMQMLEAEANALQRSATSHLLLIKEKTTIKRVYGHLYRALNIPEGTTRSNCRAIAMFIAAGVLKQSDMTLPGQHFKFTMERPEQSTMPNGISLRRHNPANSIVPGRGVRMPKVQDKSLGNVSLTARERTYLSCSMWGMSSFDMADDPNVPGEYEVCKRGVSSVNKKLGVLDTAHAVAHGLLEGFVEISDDILEPGAPFSPKIYDEGIELDIARQPYRLSERQVPQPFFYQANQGQLVKQVLI